MTFGRILLLQGITVPRAVLLWIAHTDLLTDSDDLAHCETRANGRQESWEENPVDGRTGEEVSGDCKPG